MYRITGMLLLLLIVILGEGPYKHSWDACTLIKKEKKEIERIFGEGPNMEALPIPVELASTVESFESGDCVHLIKYEGKVEGYILSTRAMGRFEFFDYSVIFSNQFTILAIMVTVYRSTHGAAICQKRWLEQFKGYSGGDLALGQDIDAVSGATFSASSLVKDIQRSRQLMLSLRDRELLR